MQNGLTQAQHLILESKEKHATPHALERHFMTVKIVGVSLCYLNMISKAWNVSNFVLFLFPRQEMPSRQPPFWEHLWRPVTCADLSVKLRDTKTPLVSKYWPTHLQCCCWSICSQQMSGLTRQEEQSPSCLGNHRLTRKSRRIRCRASDNRDCEFRCPRLMPLFVDFWAIWGSQRPL